MNYCIIGIVSGYFNPLHKGHLEYLHAAKSQTEYLIVIVNNDEQVKLKGTVPFMDQSHRCYIMEHIREVDEVMLSIDTDKTVCQSIAKIRDKYPEHKLSFFNSGDRVGKENIEAKEEILCKKLGIKYVAIPLPKIYSSSDLIANGLKSV